MTNTTIPRHLELAQDRTESLQDSLQDLTYRLEESHHPPCNHQDLQRAVDACESIFHILAIVRTRLQAIHGPSHR